MLAAMIGIWLTSFTIDLTADATTFLERVADYVDRKGYTDLDLDNSSLVAKKGWISGTWYGGNLAATAPFERLNVELVGSAAKVTLSSARMLVVFYLIIPIWAAVGLWWMPLVSRVLAGLLLATARYVFTQVQGSWRIRASLARLAK